MKLAITSDVHLEFGDLDFANDNNADVLILGGDIFIAEDLNYLEPVPINDVIMPSRMALRAQRCYDFVQRCCERFPRVVLIMGNHEHYHGDFAESTWLIRKTFAEFENLHFLDNQFTVIDDVVFFGGTLWTDMNGEDPVTMQQIRFMMNDYQSVRNTTKREGFYTKKFLPEDSVQDHQKFLTELKKVLAVYPTQKTVVVGHHAPSKASTHPRYKHETVMNGAYSTNLDEFILDNPNIKLWTHGHTHEDFDYRIGSTRVVCNPRGYDGVEERADHFELKYVEI
jgi:DNA repair exonuclease SbcCD nuclease subunit